MTHSHEPRYGLDQSGPLERSTIVLVVLLGGLLIVGYVVLAAIGRDTTGYLLFVGGPAMTSLVGLLINRRVAAVAATVETIHEQAVVLSDLQVPALHGHMDSQDVVLEQIAGLPAGSSHLAPADPPVVGTDPLKLPIQRPYNAGEAPLQVPPPT